MSMEARNDFKPLKQARRKKRKAIINWELKKLKLIAV